MEYASPHHHNSQSVALAFAVAALQRGETTPEQLLGGTSSSSRIGIAMGSQPAGSGTQERHDSTTMTHQQDVDDDDDMEKRLAKSRERNREHARRTRLRKKAHLENLQARVKELESERQALRQKMEECSIASILLRLSSTTSQEDIIIDDATTTAAAPGTTDANASVVPTAKTTGRRKRFYSDATEPSEPLKVNIDGELTIIGGGCHVNWKTGMYSDGAGVQRKLTNEQLKQLRRERNRMHAKLTRDRKKCFISSLEKTIAELEAEVQGMRDTLPTVITPSVSPAVHPTEPPPDAIPCKRVKHGFSLVG